MATRDSKPAKIPPASEEPEGESDPLSIGDEGATDGGTLLAHLIDALAAQSPASARYRLSGEIAHGGMGTVSKAFDRHLRRSLAVKTALARDLRGNVDPRTLARFVEEAQVTGQLEHPGIVPVHDIGLDEHGHCYFTMRLVKGRDLKRIIDLVATNAEEWNLTRALGVILKVCEAVAYAHSKGVIHRDLKPANVMVGKFGEVYVMDWGIARVAGRKDTHDVRVRSEASVTLSVETDRRQEKEQSPDSPLMTMDGDVIGTPCYMPPEQAQGKVELLGPRSDVYSIGAMLYHLLTDQMPYVRPGQRATPRTVLGLVMLGPPRPIHEITRDVPAELVAICEKAMARDPEQRYVDTLEMAHDLRAYLEHRVVTAYETGALAELKSWIARNKELALVTASGIAALVVGIAVIAVLYVRAQANEHFAREETAKVLRLADLKRLTGHRAQAEEFWPALPDKVPAMEAWLASAESLMGRLPMHQATLASLRQAALPYDDAAAEEDRRTHPRAEELAELKAHRADLAGQAPPSIETARTERTGELAELDRRIAELEQRVGERRTWKFRDVETQFQHDSLVDLIDELVAFGGTDRFSDGIESVRRRFEFARTVRTNTLERWAGAWDQTIASIRSRTECPLYDGLVISPQLGLIPLGRDPRSGLCEFVHLQTGAVPQRDPQGKLLLGEETGIVFVLIPGGSFWIGSQSDDPNGANYDPQAHPYTSPVQRITLDPYFLSKYEMTQGQWERLTGTRPSRWGPGTTRDGKRRTLMDPVEQVSPQQALIVLARLGLELPTEAQWEFAARAGTTTIWSTGNEKESLRGYANFLDLFAKNTPGSPDTWTYDEWLDDGWGVHAPVGRFLPNLWGLHDVYGNVAEWCRDGWGTYNDFPGVAGGDGLRNVRSSRTNAMRGGSWSEPALEARSALRNGFASDYLADTIGLRPSRRLER